jgi:hypothetical protein
MSSAAAHLRQQSIAQSPNRTPCRSTTHQARHRYDCSNRKVDAQTRQHSVNTPSITPRGPALQEGHSSAQYSTLYNRLYSCWLAYLQPGDLFERA